MVFHPSCFMGASFGCVLSLCSVEHPSPPPRPPSACSGSSERSCPGAGRIVADLSPLLANYSTMATLQVPHHPPPNNTTTTTTTSTTRAAKTSLCVSERTHKVKHAQLTFKKKNKNALPVACARFGMKHTHTHTQMKKKSHTTNTDCSSQLALQSCLIGASFQL